MTTSCTSICPSRSGRTLRRCRRPRNGRGHARDGNVSRQLKRQIGRAQGERGTKASPVRGARPRTREQRLNRILLIGGGGLAAGAVMLALLAPRFDGGLLAFN